jgi:hypothetical protein
MDTMKDITQEEVSKLTRAMKDKQFQNHMDDYCKEISDPAHRKEYLQYLDQLEAKGEMPEGQQLLRTEPGCCVKTTIKFKNGQNQKCFINIVHSDCLQDMLEEPDGKGGKRVNLPYSLSPPRPERDNKDENCMTCDFAVSTWTFGQAIQRPNVLKMLVDTASDGLTSQFLKGHEEVKKDFKVMKRIRCRGPFARPLPMSVKAGMLKDNGKNAKPVMSSVDSKSAVTPSELREMRKTAKEKQLKPDPVENEEEESAKSWPQNSQEEVEPAKAISGPPRIRVPKHKLIHSGQYDLTDFMEASNRPTAVAQSIPRLLKLVVELPTVKKSSDVSLEVTSFNVCIEVQDKYYLDLPLSYEIDDENGEAKFDKVTQTLTLELPVKLKPPDPNLIANRGGFPTGDEGEEEEEEGETGEDGALRDGDNEDELPLLEDVPSEDPPAQASAAEPQPESPSSQQAQVEVKEAAPPAEELVPEEELARFIPAKCFEGAKPGYFFGTRDGDLGYYRDIRQRRPAREQPEGGTHPVTPSTLVPAKGSTDHGAPLIEEVDGDALIPSGFHRASSAKTPAPKQPLSRRAQRYLDSSWLLTSSIPASEMVQGSINEETTVGSHQTRQNLLLLVGIPTGHEVAGLQLSFVSRRLTMIFCTRPIGGSRWQRCHIRRTLCRAVDLRQWNAETQKGGADDASNESSLLIVLRKVEQEIWPEVFDRSATAVAADREPIIADVVAPAVVSSGSRSSVEQDAFLDTAESADPDIVVVEDSAELDIAVPAGAPAALGPTPEPGGAKAAGVPQTQHEWNASAASAAAQSASVMGQAVLLRTRLMYQLF